MKRLFITVILVLILNALCYSQWSPIGPYGGRMITVASSGTNVAVSAHRTGVFTSSNNGSTWIFANNGITTVYTNSLCYTSNYLLAGTSRGIFQSTNNGVNWVQNSLNNKVVNVIYTINNYIFAGTNDSGIYISSNNGVNWTQSNTGLTNKFVKAIVNCGSYIFAGTNGGVFLSIDNGASWASKSWGFCSIPFEITSLAVVGNTIFAESYWGCGVYRSINYGNNWYQANNGLPSSVYVSSLGSNGSNLYAGTTYNAGDYSTGLYVTSNSGTSWSNLDNGQIKGIIYGISCSGQNIFVCTMTEYLTPSIAGGVYQSTNSGLNWAKINNGICGLPLSTIAIIGSYIFTGYDGVYASSNSGGNWNQLTSPSINRRIQVLTSSGTNLYAGTEDSSIFVSSNYGVNWAHVPTSSIPNVLSVSALAVSGNNIFAGAGDLYISSNSGVNWRVLNDTSLHVGGVSDILISGTTIFAGFNTGGVCRSTNNGLNWVKINNGLNSPNYYLMGLAKDGQNLYSCFYWGTGIFISTNNGDNWVKISNEISNWNFTTIAAYDSKIFVGADSAIFYSSNFGANWNRIYQGFPNNNYFPLINKLYIANGYIYAATNYRSVWRRPLSDIVGIRNVGNEIPKIYSLEQNYPNPFNPTTKIKFDVVKSGNVKIVVYDVTGREVQTLLNERLQPGTYETTFDGSGLTSGVYFYRILVRHGGSSTDGYSKTKKMLMIK